MNHNFHATALCKLVLPEIAPCKPRDVRCARLVVEAQREGAPREHKENKPRNGAAGGKEELCRIQPLTGDFLRVKVEIVRVSMRDEVWKWVLCR